MRIWDVVKGTEVAQFISFADGEWVAITPDGYFNASSGAAKYINVRIGNDVFPIDKYYKTYFRPDIIRERLR
jgi:hypothetical protein